MAPDQPPQDRHGEQDAPSPVPPPTAGTTDAPVPSAAPPLPSEPPETPVPPGPTNPLRATAVALLNLSGLGVGYVLLRRWLLAAVCWLATGCLLRAALPADPDGVPGAALLAYAAFLGLVVAHGAFAGRRTRLSWPPRTALALVLGVVLLAVPASGAVLYGHARDEAVEQALLDRLERADRLVQGAKNQPFETAASRYRKALATYHDLDAHHTDSRAGRRLPHSLQTYYATVAAPYDRKKYCDAIEPLKYLRKVPGSIDRRRLGTLATWPDGRLATSLYECGVKTLGDGGQDDTEHGDLAELLTGFPRSPQAAKVEPAVAAAIDAAAEQLKGDEPCAATERLRTLSGQAAALPGDRAGVADALSKDADRAKSKVRSGTYTCGVDAYEDGDFEAALATMNDFVDRYRHDKKRASARRIAIAAEIAQHLPAAGKHLPSARSGGGIAVTVKNDSPDEIEILYTGPVTGSFTLGPCHDCSTYGSRASASASPCKAGRNYPARTLHLPAGTTYLLHKKVDGTGDVATDVTRLEPGYAYTECAYVVQDIGWGGYGGGGSSGDV